MNPNKLFVYGTLRPNQPNEHWLKNIGGGFTPATVRGVLLPNGWGAASGFPALIPCQEGQQVDGLVFESEDLPKHWQALDEFEGKGYERVLVEVSINHGETQTVWVYALAVSEQDKQMLMAT